MGEESWRRKHGEGIMEEESWRRNQGGGIMGGGIGEEESGRRNHGGGIMEETSERLLRGICKASGDTQETPRKHPGGTQGHPGTPRGTQEAPRRSEASGTHKL